jgi:hypothetical protein
MLSPSCRSGEYWGKDFIDPYKVMVIRVVDEVFFEMLLFTK